MSEPQLTLREVISIAKGFGREDNHLVLPNRIADVILRELDRLYEIDEAQQDAETAAEMSEYEFAAYERRIIAVINSNPAVFGGPVDERYDVIGFITSWLEKSYGQPFAPRAVYGEHPGKTPVVIKEAE